MSLPDEIELPALPDRLAEVPLFPLPDVVLFASAILPLHIFEPRYRAMTADALCGDGLIVMGHMRDRSDAAAELPPVHEVAGIGKIIRHQQLDDGRYNLLLVGLRRVRILSETSPAPYRRADVEVLAESPVFEIDLDPHRQRFRRVLERAPLSELALGRQLLKLFDGPHPTVELAGLIAFELLDNAELKQAILDESDLTTRVARTARAFDLQYPDPADAALRMERKLFD